MFVPESDRADVGETSDPFMSDEIVEKETQHRAVHVQWKHETQQQRLATLREQILEYKTFYAVQKHINAVQELVSESFQDRGEMGEPQQQTSAMPLSYVEEMRQKAMAMRKKAQNVHRLSMPDNMMEEEEEENEVVAVRLPKRAQMEDGGFDEDLDRVKSHVSRVNEALADLGPLIKGQPNPALETLAEEWMIPWEWADGARDFNTPTRKCRLLFFAQSMSKSEVKECTLFSSYSPTTDYVTLFEKAGVSRSEMLAMVGVPFFHAGQWGEYNNVPTAMRRLFLTYIREAVFLLHPIYIVTTNRIATEWVQMGFNPDAKSPEDWPLNLVDIVRLGKGITTTLLRVAHPYSIRDDDAACKLRNDALERLASRATPIRKQVNAFDKLMGRAGASEVAQGGLIWCMHDRIGVSSFPTPEELGQMLRNNVRFIINLTTRAVKGPAKSGWRGEEIKLAPDADLLTFYTALHDTLALMQSSQKIVIVCATGVRYSMMVACMYRMLLLGPYASPEETFQWALEQRTVEISPSDRQTLYGFYDVVCGFFPLPVKSNEKAWAVCLHTGKKNERVLGRARSEGMAKLTGNYFLDVLKACKKRKAKKWALAVRPWKDKDKPWKVEKWKALFVKKAKKLTKKLKRTKKKKQK